MHKIHSMLLLLILSLAAASSHAADDKPAKPQVCADFRVLESKGADGKPVVLGVCYDGKRPALFSSWTYVDLVVNGAKRRYAVGFR